MDFRLSAAEEAFRDGLRAWLEANCPKDWSRVRRTLANRESLAAFLIDWQRRLHAAFFEN